MTSLSQFTLLGLSPELEAAAVPADPLLGHLVLRGQATIWYAPPNSGKTLILFHLLIDTYTKAKANPGRVFVINADDNSSGLAAKAQICDELGINMLAPNHRGFKVRHLAESMKAMVIDGSAKDTFIVIDTLKKFVDLMHKKESTEFAGVVREFVAAGGTVLALAHTNKNKSAGGKLIYTGTTDFLEDFDAAYIIEPREDMADGLRRTVQFQSVKSRGGSAEGALFSFHGGHLETYGAVLHSVQQLDLSKAPPPKAADQDIIDAIRFCIGERGINVQTHILEVVRKVTQTSRRQVADVLEGHTGPDPTVHLWNYLRGDRGARVFSLHSPASEPEAQARSDDACAPQSDVSDIQAVILPVCQPAARCVDPRTLRIRSAAHDDDQ